MKSVKDIFQSIKDAFIDAPVQVAAAPEPTTNPVFKTVDGIELTVVLANPLTNTEPQIGDAVTIAGAPAAMGDYSLEGGDTISIDGMGMLSAIVEAPEVTDPATVDLSQTPALPTVEERLSAIEAEMAKNRVATPVMPVGMATEISLQLATQKVDKHEKTITAMFELIEQMIKEPSADPRTLTGNKTDTFAAKKELAIDRISKALEDIRKK